MDFENNQLQLEGQRSSAGHDRLDTRLVEPKPGNALPPGWARGYTDNLGRAGQERCLPVPERTGPGASREGDFTGPHRIAYRPLARAAPS